ncbi:helix-turn-helix domain-containing protein [Actinophytocola sp. NPDC049390]|uniref:helix-turn-helix domain-containing protein n=1 Tax=Actinophytocola sp. NPDC049390 TaxID=3363894 RepID=UPI00379FA4D1
MNSIGSQSSSVTPEAWEDQEMRNALAAREVSTIYKLLRRKGVSQRQIAAMTGQSQSEVSEILKGRQVMAYDVLVRIADGLGVPRGYMGLAYDEVTAQRVAERSETPEAEEPENVKRRKFLAHAAAVAVGAHVLGADSGSWVSNPVLTPAPGRIGMTDVRQVEAATRALRSLDYQYGGGFCRDAVVAQLSWGQQMLNSSGADVVKQRLHVALADLHNLAGWTSFDVGLIDSARNHFGRALELAKAGESDELVANILYRMGRVYLHKEAPDDALKMFQLGQIAAQQSGSELAVAVICANQAWAYAMMGHEEQTMKLIGRTRDEFARSNHGEAADWVKFFNEDDVYSMIGTVHTVLAQKVDARHTKYAIPALTRAIDSYGDEVARNKAFNLSSLATNHLLDGDIDHGSKVGVQAVDLAQHLKSKRVRDRLEPLRVEAEKRRNFTDARELADLIGRFTDDDHGATAV